MRLKLRALEIKSYSLLHDALTSDKPKDYYEMLKEKFTGSKEHLEEGIIIWHEKYVSGSDFGDERKKNRKWHQKFFNRKGQYQHERDTYRKSIV